MRRIVAVEDHIYPDGRVLAKGAVVIDEPTLPVVDVHTQERMGYAHDFKRNDETGEITMELEIEGDIDVEDWLVGSHLSPYQSKMLNDGVMLFTHGHLQAIHLHRPIHIVSEN